MASVPSKGLASLHTWRESKGLSPRQLAARIGVSYQTVYNWLNGKLPKLAHLARLYTYAGDDIVVYVNAVLAVHDSQIAATKAKLARKASSLAVKESEVRVLRSRVLTCREVAA